MITFDPDALTARRAIEAKMGEPGFWDDQAGAAQISTEHARVTRRLERYDRLTREYEDARELQALDGDMDDEIAASLNPLVAELDRLQEDALFTGEYDAGDAVVTVHSGTGGTDSQDWAEMLVRMYLRWAADRGFQTDMLEASPGEEAGLKSATFTVKGENVYGILKAERGVHRLVRMSPFDQAHRRHTSFAQVIVSPFLPRRHRGRNRRERPSDRYVPCERRRRAACQQDGFRCSHHAPADRHRRRGPERALAVVEQANRDAHPALAARRARGGRARSDREGARRAQDIGFGSQIRSYVLHPYQQVKDHRTDHEVGNAQGVLDGNLDTFIHAYLLAKAAGKVV